MEADETAPVAQDHGENVASNSAPISRRDWVGVLGALGAAIGVEALAGCTQRVGESLGQANEQLVSGGGAIAWCATVLGAAGAPAPGSRPGDLGSHTSTTLVSGATVVVAIAEGCVSPGDGGGGLFYWDPTLPASADDGGTIIVPLPGVGGAWRRIYSGPLNVQWFGAVGDGTTNDYLPITNALNACVATGGGSVRLAPKVYAHDTTLQIQSGVDLVGDGSVFYSSNHADLRGTWLKWIGSAGTSASSPQTQANLFDVQNSSFRDIGLLGNSIAYVNGISLDSDNNPTSEQIDFIGVVLAEHAVSVQFGPVSGYTDKQIADITFSNCYFVNFSDAGIRVNSTDALDDSSIARCAWYSGFGIGTGAGAVGIDIVRCGNLTVVAGAFGSDIGVQIAGANANAVTIQTSQLEPPAKWFLKLTGNMAPPIVFANNTINVGVYLGGICLVTGVGNYYQDPDNLGRCNITLNNSGAKYQGFGDIVAPSATIVANSGVYSNLLADSLFGLQHHDEAGVVESVAAKAAGVVASQQRRRYRFVQTGQTTTVGGAVTRTLGLNQTSTTSLHRVHVSVLGRVTVAGSGAAVGDFFGAVYDLFVSDVAGTVVVAGTTPISSGQSTSQVGNTVIFSTSVHALGISAVQGGTPNVGAVIDWQISIQDEVD